MKVVVAGGSGLVGRHLVARLLALGHEPVVLSRYDAGVPGARVVRWEPDVRGATRALAGAEAVVNLCGASVGAWRWTARRKRLLRESRLVPTRILVDAISSLPAADRPRVLVSASGTDTYEGRDAEPASETTPPAGTFLARLCVEWEAEARRAEAYGVRVVCLRLGLVIAPRAPALERLALPFRVFLGGRLGSGEQWLSWIDVGDAVELFVRAVERTTLQGPVNATAPDPRRQADFARALASVVGRPAAVHVPAALIRLVLGEQAVLALGSRRVWPAAALADGFRFTRPRLEDSLAAALRPDYSPSRTRSDSVSSSTDRVR